MKKWNYYTHDRVAKLYILFLVLWMILTLVAVGYADNASHPAGTAVAVSMIVLFLLFIGGLFFLLTRPVGSPYRPLPLYATVRVTPYDAFCVQLFRSAETQGFSSRQTTPLNEEAHTAFAYCTDEDGTVLLQTVWMPDFDEALVDAASNAAWNGALMELGDCFAAGNVTLLQLVCVQRMNSPFRTFAARKVYQQERRYHIVCPLSFGGKKAYLRPAKGTFLDPYYKQAQRLFCELTEEVLNVENKKK